MSGATESSPVVGGRGTVVFHLCFDKFPLGTPFGEVLGTIRLGPVCLFLLLDTGRLFTLECYIAVALTQHRCVEGLPSTLAPSRLNPSPTTMRGPPVINSHRHIPGKGLLAHINVLHHVSFK